MIILNSKNHWVWCKYLLVVYNKFDLPSPYVYYVPMW